MQKDLRKQVFLFVLEEDCSSPLGGCLSKQVDRLPDE